jgi:carbohydrate-binding DOMON domain-containing protein
MRALFLAAAALVFATSVSAQEVVFKDPVGDDKGPGTYVYPTDPVYKPGSFDIVELKVTQKGDDVTFAYTVNADIEDPWSMPDPANFSVQTAFIFVNTGKGAQSKGIPGLNVKFAEGNGWDRCVILSSQPQGRVLSEAKHKAADLKDFILVPAETTADGRTIKGTVSKKALGDGDLRKWGYQIVSQSNEGFPDKTDLLTRKVNEYEGQHRFGGGTDFDCDPHVMDVIAGKGTGDKSEVEEQKKMLSYECGPDGSSKRMAELKMVRK